jgi:hypothetical protein
LVLAAEGRERGVLLPGTAMGVLLADVVEDASAFCREKHGDSPEIRLLQVRASSASATDEGDVESDSVLLAPYLAFPLHELLKNSMGAHCRLVGADQLDRLPPIDVRHGIHHGNGFISVVDFGGGVPNQVLESAYAHEGPAAVQGLGDAATREGVAASFLCSTNPEREPTYTYSRNFGSTFEGLGMGLPLAALHARYLGGELHLRHVAPQPLIAGGGAGGLHAAFTFRAAGDQPEPDEELEGHSWRMPP